MHALQQEKEEQGEAQGEDGMEEVTQGETVDAREGKTREEEGGETVAGAVENGVERGLG